jgi:hypothetical protein
MSDLRRLLVDAVNDSIQAEAAIEPAQERLRAAEGMIERDVSRFTFP